MRRKIKKPKSGNKSRRYIIIAALFFIVLFFSILLLYFSKWNGKSRFTVVVQTLQHKNLSDKYNISIFSIEPASRRAVYIDIPGNVLFNVPFGYKTYVASSIYQLGEMDEKRNGVYLVKKSAESTLNVPIDGFVAFKSDYFAFPKNSDDVKKIKQQHFSLPSIFTLLFSHLNKHQQVETDISFIDKIKLWNAVRKLRTDQIEYIDLGSTQCLEDDILPDKTIRKRINPELFDVVVGDLFQDIFIRNENLAIEVENAANVEGLAKTFSKTLEFMGANVISKSTGSDKQVEECKVLISKKDLKSSYIVSRLVSFYKCDVEEVRNKEDILASDIKIILGEYFARNY